MEARTDFLTALISKPRRFPVAEQTGEERQAGDFFWAGAAKTGAAFAPGHSEFNEKTFKKSVSQFRAVAICGAHPSGEGVNTLETAVDMAAQLRIREADFRTSLFQAVVNVAVAQKKVEHALTPEEIAEVLNPTKTDKPWSLAEAVEAVAKTASNLIKGKLDPEGNVAKPPSASICPIANQRLESALSTLLLALEAANAAEGRTTKA